MGEKFTYPRVYVDGVHVPQSESRHIVYRESLSGLKKWGFWSEYCDNCWMSVIK